MIFKLCLEYSGDKNIGRKMNNVVTFLHSHAITPA